MSRLIVVLLLSLLVVFSSALHVSPTDGRINKIGRIAVLSTDDVMFDWSNSGFSFRYLGTKATVSLKETREGRFQVTVDGIVQPPLVTAANVSSYTLYAGQAKGIHVIEMLRITEAEFKATHVYGFEIDGTLMDPPVLPSRKILFVGDSITCGYGVEGKSPCPFTAATENSQLAYSGVTARAVGASMQTVSWSGKGMVRNYGYINTTSPDAMPSYFGYTLGTVKTYKYDFSYKPDVVVIALGTNDYSTKPSPSYDEFAGGYHEFLSVVRSAYPYGPKIVCTCQVDIFCPHVEQIVKEEVALGHNEVSFVNNSMNKYLDPSDLGCNGHPGVSGAAKMANALVDHLRLVMRW